MHTTIHTNRMRAGSVYLNLGMKLGVDVYNVILPLSLPPSLPSSLPPYFHSTLVYELVLLGKPFKNVPRECVIWRVGSGRLQPLSLLPRDRLRGIIQRCWKLNPDSRPTFKTILSDVEQNVSNNIHTRLATRKHTRTHTLPLYSHSPLLSWL